MQSLEYRGEYPANWDELAAGLKVAVDYRCVRCFHRFEPTQVRVNGFKVHLAQLCDDVCDPERCRALRIHDRGGVHCLTVHHLDGDKANGAWWNLLVLCNSCHLQVQAKVIVERPWLFDHSEWFQVYVAGFYAKYYGGVDITREQAFNQLEYWLGLNPARPGAGVVQ